MSTPPNTPRPKRNIPMTIIGLFLVAIAVSLVILAAEALFFSISVH